MSADDAEVFYKLMKAGAKQAVKKGSTKVGLPDEVARFLASQLSFTFDLVKKGHRITPGYLSLLLAQKGLGIAGLVVSKRFDCAMAVLFLSLSLTKSVAFTTLSGPGHFVATAAELLADCYSVDKSCGVSDAMYEQVERVALPASMWLEQGVVQWLSRGQ